MTDYDDDLDEGPRSKAELCNNVKGVFISPLFKARGQ